MAERIVIVGGNAAGMTAAGRAKRLRPDLDVTVLEMSHFISYSICGLPYFTFGQVDSHERLITFTPESLARERDIRARTRIRVDEIQRGRRRLLCTDLESGQGEVIGYDRLVLATGYRPRVPAIDGVDLANVFTAAQLEDGLRLRYAIENSPVRRAAVVGGGYVGLMMACGLRRLGLEVALFERQAHVYSQVDDAIARRLERALSNRGIQLHLKSPVRRLVGNETVQEVETDEKRHPGELVLIDVGVDPRSDLAEAAGIACGVSGGIGVDGRGQTGDPAVYAAGNCAETTHLVSGRAVVSRLGTTAARQGRVVGENLAGVRSEFAGTLETSVEQIFDTGVGRTGLTLRQARAAGFEAASVEINSRDRARYLPSSTELAVALVYERRGGRVLGGQLVGEGGAPKRIDTLAAVVSGGMTLRELAQLDLAYAPPFGTLWDPFQVAAHVALR